jgi:hypothetical protein
MAHWARELANKVTQVALLQRRSSVVVHNYHQLWFMNQCRWATANNPGLSTAVHNMNRCCVKYYQQQESSFWTFIQIDRLYRHIDLDYAIVYINQTFIISHNLNHCQTYEQYMSRTTVLNNSLCTIHVQNHSAKHTIHFDFLLTEESEPCWFFFGGFHFLDGEGGCGDSWPMVNLATWCLPIGRMTSSFMNSNNYSYTARILCGVRYCLLKSICCNFKN